MSSGVAYNMLGQGSSYGEDHAETRVMLGVDGVGRMVATGSLDVLVDGEPLENLHRLWLSHENPEPTGRRVWGSLGFVYWKSQYEQEGWRVQDQMPVGRNITISYGAGDSREELYRFTDVVWGNAGGGLGRNRIDVVITFTAEDLDV